VAIVVSFVIYFYAEWD